MSKHVILLTTHKSKEWRSDTMITQGLMNLLPELADCNITFFKDITADQINKYIAECDYVIQAGTSTWTDLEMRMAWRACVQHNKHIALLGIGSPVHYLSDMWYGSEDFVRLKDSELLDHVVCRDKYCYHWLKRLRHNIARFDLMPCPSFYAISHCHTNESKAKVILSLVNVEEEASQTSLTFRKYYEKTLYLISELKNRGAEVSLLHQHDSSRHNFMRDFAAELFNGEVVHSHKSHRHLEDFILERDIYIGVGNQICLPCAGSGKPSLLLGIDYTQAVAAEIPYINVSDMSYVEMQIGTILDWYDSLHPLNLGESLRQFRDITQNRWQIALEPLKKIITS